MPQCMRPDSISVHWRLHAYPRLCEIHACISQPNDEIFLRDIQRSESESYPPEDQGAHADKKGKHGAITAIIFVCMWMWVSI
jgi:hypothetical protein